MADYFSTPAISRSSLMTLKESPEEYHAIHLNGEADDFEETDSILRGTVAHAAFEDINSVRERFAIIPEEIKVRRGKKWDEFRKHCASIGKSPVKAVDIERSVRTAESLKLALKDALDSAVKIESEVVCLWTEPILGLECKSMLDLKLTLKTNEIVVIDIKTSDERPTGWKFRKSAKSYGYWLQDVHYSRGCEVLWPDQPLRDFVFASIQTQGRYPCRLFRFDPITRAESHAKRMLMLEEIKRRTDANDWLDEDHGLITDISLAIE